EVFAIPGSIHSPLSRGCHALIRQGAKLDESAQDIDEELGQPNQAPYLENTQIQAAATVSAPPAQDPTGQRILDAMGFDPVDLDTLQRRTQLDLPLLNSHLLG